MITKLKIIQYILCWTSVYFGLNAIIAYAGGKDMGMSALVAVLTVAMSLAVVMFHEATEAKLLRMDHKIMREDHKHLSEEHQEIAQTVIAKLDALDMKQEKFKEYVTSYIAKEESEKTTIAVKDPPVKFTEETSFLYNIIAWQEGEVAQLKLELQKTKALLKVEKDINSQLRQELSAERSAHQQDINQMRELSRSHEDDDLEK